MTKVPLVKITDDTIGVILPEDVLARLEVAEGDDLILTEEPNGIYLRTAKQVTARQIEIGREIIRRRDDVLRKLSE